MRKYLIVVLILVFAVSMVFVGSGKKDKAAPDAGTKIRFMFYTSPDYDAIKALGPEFTEKTGIEVEFIEDPIQNMYEKIVLEATTGSGETDVWAMNAWWIPLMIGSGYIEPLDDYIAKQGDPDIDDIYEPVLDYYRVGGKLYSLPIYPGVMFIFYNYKFFEEEGLDLPETWEEFFEVSLKFKKDIDGDGHIDRYGAIAPLAKDESVVETYLVFLDCLEGDWIRGTHGGDMDPMEGTDEYLKPTMNNELGVKALEFMADMYQQEAFNPGCINLSFFDAAEAFGQGKAAMYISYADQGPMIYTPDVKEGANIRSVAMPHFEGFDKNCLGGGWSAGINANSENKEAAYEFLKFFFGDKEVGKRMAAMDATPFRKSILTDPELSEKYEWYGAMNEMLPWTKPYPFIPEFPEQALAASQYLQQALIGELTAQEALDKIAADVLQSMTRAGYYD